MMIVKYGEIDASSCLTHRFHSSLMFSEISLLRSQGEPLAHPDKQGMLTGRCDQKHEGLYPDLPGSFYGKICSFII